MVSRGAELFSSQTVNFFFPPKIEVRFLLSRDSLSLAQGERVHWTRGSLPESLGDSGKLTGINGGVGEAYRNPSATREIDAGACMIDAVY